jgi:hypothetical protein
MGVADWLTLLFPSFLRLLEALAADGPEAERDAMIALQRGIARGRAAKKFGPRTDVK